MSADEQNKLVADYIMANDIVPRPEEGAGRCAVRLLMEYRATIQKYQEQVECADEDYLEQLANQRAAFVKIMDELGVPDEYYPASVANAYEIAVANAYEIAKCVSGCDDTS